MGCASSKDAAAVLPTAPADGSPSKSRSTSPRQNADGLTAKTLKSAARSGAAVLKLVPARVPGDLSAWASGLRDDREAEAWLEAIQAALDALWEPIVSKVDARLAAPGAVPAYDTLKPASLLALVRDVASVPDQQQWPAAAACDGLLRMGAALWQRTQGPGRAPSAEVEARFVNASLCRLLTFLSLALTGTVAVEDAESFDAKLDAWRTLLTAFGLGRPHLCALIDAASKGLLLYMDAVVRGDTQLRLTCERGTALSEGTARQWEQSSCHRGSASATHEGGQSRERYPNPTLTLTLTLL